VQNASEGMVGAILGLSVWHVTALSGVGRQDCPCKRRPVRIRQSKVNRPNVAGEHLTSVTSPPIYWWVVDSIAERLCIVLAVSDSNKKLARGVLPSRVSLMHIME